MSLDKFLADGENLVIKIGGSVLTCDEDYRKQALRIKELSERFFGRIYAVVSARKGRTDELIEEEVENKDLIDSLNVCLQGVGHPLIRQQYDNPHVASYLLRGEIESARKLKSELNDLGVKTDELYQGINFPIIANSSYLSAEIDLNKSYEKAVKIFRELTERIVIVPGFGAENEGGEKVLLGRNASDLVAAVVGNLDEYTRLVVYLKDVKGIFRNFGMPNQELVPLMSFEDFKKGSYGCVLDQRVADYAGCNFLIQHQEKEFGSEGTLITFGGLGK